MNANTKVIADIITDEDFIGLWWEEATMNIDCNTKTNPGWHTYDGEKSIGTYVIGASNK